MATSTSPAPGPATPFRLLSLPDEIWTKIGKLALTFTNDITVGCRHPPHNTISTTLCRTCKSFPLQPPLTRVNRVLHAELLPHFYRTALFRIQKLDTMSFEPWLKALGRENVENMTTLQIITNDVGTEFQERVLRRFEEMDCGLEGFEVMVAKKGWRGRAKFGVVVLKRGGV